MNHITGTYIVTNFMLAIIFLQCSTSAPYLQMMCFMLSQEWAIFFFLTTRTEHSSKALWLERTNILLSWVSIVSSVSDSSAFLVLPAQDQSSGLMWQETSFWALWVKVPAEQGTHTHTHICVCLIFCSRGAWSPVLLPRRTLQFSGSSTLTLICTDMTDV